MKIGVIRFPGTNCDRDVAHAIKLAGLTPEYVWWNEENLTDYEGIVICCTSSTAATASPSEWPLPRLKDNVAAGNCD